MKRCLPRLSWPAFFLLLAGLLAANIGCDDNDDDDAAPADDDQTGDDDDDDDNDNNDNDNNDDNNDNDNNDNDNNDNDDNDTSPPENLKVVTFNLRTGLAFDGLDSWPWRKSIAAAFVESEMPDIMGTQEGYRFQLEYLRENVPGYEWVGEPRRFLDERCAVFYQTDRFALLETGAFWLSDTPDVPGSQFSENQLCPRIVTWTELEETATGATLTVFNTHFDTTNQDEVPQRSAALLVEKIEEIAGDSPVLVTGDFNEQVDSEAYRILTGALEYHGVTGSLLDPWVVLGLPEAGSMHPWDSEIPSIPSRIDWVLCSEDFLPLTGEISHFQVNGHFPTDHFPVIVEFSPEW